MKIGVISDIHGNLSALESVVMELKKEGISRIINAGDITGYSPFPNECVDLLRKENVQSVLGNFDEEIAFNRPISYFSDVDDETLRTRLLSMQWTQRHTSIAAKKYLSSLPRHLKTEIDGVRLFSTHGGLNRTDEFIHERDWQAQQTIAETLVSDVIILGHTRRAFVSNIKGKLFVNPGSVGKPEDGDPRASYAVVDLSEKRAFICRVSYNISRTVQGIMEAGLPEEIAINLSTGRIVLRSAGQLERIAS